MPGCAGGLSVCFGCVDVLCVRCCVYLYHEAHTAATYTDIYATCIAMYAIMVISWYLHISQTCTPTHTFYIRHTYTYTSLHTYKHTSLHTYTHELSRGHHSCFPLLPPSHCVCSQSLFACLRHDMKCNYCCVWVWLCVVIAVRGVWFMEWDALVVLGCTWEPHKHKQCVVGV